MGGEAEHLSCAWTNRSLADADVIILEADEAHHVMQRHPHKQIIIVQQCAVSPVHATLVATRRYMERVAFPCNVAFDVCASLDKTDHCRAVSAELQCCFLRL